MDMNKKMSWNIDVALSVTGTWGRKLSSSGLPTDWGKSWEPAHCLDQNAENTARALEGPCVDRVPRGVLLWSGVGKPGDLGDRPADKISACSDQGPEIRRICRPDHRDCCVPLSMDCFLMPSYCMPALGICLICSISS